VYWVIFGAGNFLADIIDAIESNGDSVSELVLNYDIDHIIKNYDGKTTFIDSYKPDDTKRHIFGFVNPNKDLFLEQLKKHEIKFHNLIHKNAYIAKSAELGVGNYIGAGCVIGPGVKLGTFNYLNRCSSIGHHTTIDSFNHVGPGATICGRCNIGSSNYIGAASCVRDGITIEKDIILGMGAGAVCDLKNPGIYIGIPAKRSR